MAPDFRIAMTAPERDLMLTYFEFSPGLAARLRLATLGKEFLEVGLSKVQLVELCDTLDYGIPKVRKAKDGEILTGFLMSLLKFLKRSKLEHILDMDDEEGDQEEAVDPLPPESPRAEKIREIVNSGLYKTRDELQAALDKASKEHNHTPQADRCGLTPYHMVKLMYTEWDDPENPIRFNTDLSPLELESIPWVHAAITLLTMAEAANGLKLTPNGWLNRATVRALIEAGLTPNFDLEGWQRHSKNIDEFNVRDIWMLRAILQNGGLLRKLKGKLTVSRAGKEVLKKGGCGELLRWMFVQLFRNTDLAAFDAMPEVPALQDMIAYSCYAIQCGARESVDLEVLSQQALIEPVRMQFVDRSHFSLSAGAFEHRIIAPLCAFGMVHKIQEGRKIQVQCTPLFYKFLSFEFSSPA